jgi:hypothetical protein
MKYLLFAIILLTSCSDSTSKDPSGYSGNEEARKTADSCAANSDSVEIVFFPIEGFKNQTTGNYTPMFQILIDSISQYKKIQTLVKDSGASFFIRQGNILTKGNLDNCSMRIDKKNIHVIVKNETKEFLEIKYNYLEKTFNVLSTSSDTTHSSLREWGLHYKR